MSQENVEKMRQALDAFDRRDRPAWLALCDQDHEVVRSSAWPEAEVIRGGEAVWDFYVGVIEAFERQALGDAVVVDGGADRVLVHQRTLVRGRTSGADVELDYWVVVTFREGKILRDHWFADRAEALEAVGLAE
jgi:ketosteroid isomerase-like protein